MIPVKLDLSNYHGLISLMWCDGNVLTSYQNIESCQMKNVNQLRKDLQFLLFDMSSNTKSKTSSNGAITAIYLE